MVSIRKSGDIPLLIRSEPQTFSDYSLLHKKVSPFNYRNYSLDSFEQFYWQIILLQDLWVRLKLGGSIYFLDLSLLNFIAVYKKKFSKT